MQKKTASIAGSRALLFSKVAIDALCGQIPSYLFIKDISCCRRMARAFILWSS
jgi:hypothetical protein